MRHFTQYLPSSINFGQFFARFGRHILPVIHCILTGKLEEIYTAVLVRIHELVPQLTPINELSNWEKADRNAVKTQFLGIHLRGCHFHYSQSVWRKIQKLGLSNANHTNSEFKTLIRTFMAFHFSLKIKFDRYIIN